MSKSFTKTVTYREDLVQAVHDFEDGVFKRVRYTFQIIDTDTGAIISTREDVVVESAVIAIDPVLAPAVAYMPAHADEKKDEVDQAKKAADAVAASVKP